VGKNKLQRFAENDTRPNLIQPKFDDVFKKDHPIKGNWSEQFFKNDKPIVLELGCGKGEYTVGLGSMFPEKNFIGVDIKGARLWRGAKTAHENNMNNVGFLRTRIENITSFFAKDEVSEIWVTFPDPQLKRDRALKRLTSSVFLNAYKTFLKPQGLIHLKTDSIDLHRYTRTLVENNGLKVHQCTDNLYETLKNDPILSIKTFYEEQFLEKGFPITYICFELSNTEPIVERKYQRT